MISAENNSHMVFVGSDEVAWRNLLHAVTRSKVIQYFVLAKWCHLIMLTVNVVVRPLMKSLPLHNNQRTCRIMDI